MQTQELQAQELLPQVYSPFDEVEDKTFGKIVDCHGHPLTENTLTRLQYEGVVKAPPELEDIWKLTASIRKEAISTFFDRIIKSISFRKNMGISAWRVYVDLGSDVGFEALAVAIEAKKICKKFRFTLQIAAYPTKSLSNSEMIVMLRKACTWPEVDVIGLLPSRDRPKGKIEDPVVLRDMERGFEIAAEFDKAIDMQVDQKNHPNERETYLMSDLAAKYRAEGYKRPIAATHCLSMSAWEDRVFILDTLDMMAANDVSMIVCPRATLDNKQIREVMSVTHNSIAPWDLALERGVNVAIGVDNVRDLYMPWCDGDIWKDVSVLLHSVRYRKDPEQIVKILTANGLKALGINNGV